MGLLIDGDTTIATSAKVYVDGVSMNNVYVDGVLVWTKAASSVTWSPCYTGSLIIPFYMDIGPGGDCFTESGYVENAYTNMSYVNIYDYIQRGLIQADAVLWSEMFSGSGASMGDRIMDELVANTSSTCLTGNLPWVPNSGSGIGSELLMPDQVASSVWQGAITGWFSMCGYIVTEFFEVTALYYGV